MANDLQPRYGEAFIHKQDSDLQRSLPVELEQIRRARASHDDEYLVSHETETAFAVSQPEAATPPPATLDRPHHGLDHEVHTKPAEKIEDWLAVLKRTHEGHRDDPRVLERIKTSYHKRYVIEETDIPEAAYQLEARIARNMGHGDIPITDEYRHEKAAQIIGAQQGSLDRWVDYLTSEDAIYPMWLKYWAFTSVTKMGKFEKQLETDDRGREHESARFARRTEDSVAPFPPLNPRALALTLGAIEVKAAQLGIPKAAREAPENTSSHLDDSAFQRLLATESFSKLYAQFLIELPAYSAVGLRETRGNWVRYDQGSDASPLVDSLEGHPLEWCTADLGTARGQLDEGDFYVYYSLDEAARATIPRVAIRMEDDEIAEVRGIAPGQELDPYISDVVAEKMAEFPDGELYAKRAADMKRLTEIDERVEGGGVLSRDDLRFLYEIDDYIIEFGDESDPRIQKLLDGRDFIADIEGIFETTDHNLIVRQLAEPRRAKLIYRHLDDFHDLDYKQLVDQLIEADVSYPIPRHLDKFRGLNHSQVARQLIVAGKSRAVAESLDNFHGLDDLDYKQLADQLIKEGGGSYSLAKYLDRFRGLNHSQVAHQIIEAGEDYIVAMFLDNFHDLDTSVYSELRRRGYIS